MKRYPIKSCMKGWDRNFQSENSGGFPANLQNWIVNKTFLESRVHESPYIDESQVEDLLDSYFGDEEHEGGTLDNGIDMELDIDDRQMFVQRSCWILYHYFNQLPNTLKRDYDKIDKFLQIICKDWNHLVKMKIFNDNIHEYEQYENICRNDDDLCDNMQIKLQMMMKCFDDTKYKSEDCELFEDLIHVMSKKEMMRDVEDGIPSKQDMISFMIDQFDYLWESRRKTNQINDFKKIMKNPTTVYGNDVENMDSYKEKQFIKEMVKQFFENSGLMFQLDSNLLDFSGNKNESEDNGSSSLVETSHKYDSDILYNTFVKYKIRNIDEINDEDDFLEERTHESMKKEIHGFLNRYDPFVGHLILDMVITTGCNSILPLLFTNNIGLKKYHYSDLQYLLGRLLKHVQSIPVLNLFHHLEEQSRDIMSWERILPMGMADVPAKSFKMREMQIYIDFSKMSENQRKDLEKYYQDRVKQTVLQQELKERRKLLSEILEHVTCKSQEEEVTLI